MLGIEEDSCICRKRNKMNQVIQPENELMPAQTTVYFITEGNHVKNEKESQPTPEQ